MKHHAHSRYRKMCSLLLLALALPVSACAALQPSDPTTQISVTYLPTATPIAQPTQPAPIATSAAQQDVVNVALQVTPTAPPAATPTAVHFAFAPPGLSALITGIRHERQTWNNCGPATLSMLLSHYGRTETQREAAAFLKPDKEDKNVSPHELVAYAESLGYGARVVAGGDVTLLKTLVQNGLPVIAESWFIPKPDDEMGHYQLLMGYDGDTLIFYDSYEGPNLQEQVQQFDGLWKVFNRTAVVVWTAEQAPLVQAILGERMDDHAMNMHALANAQAAIAANAQDKFAWFNAGSSMLALGRKREAVDAFDAAIKLKLPWRMMWYQFGPYAAYFDQGRYADVIELANATLGRMKVPNLEESFYWRGRAQAALGKIEAARADLQQALKFNPHYAEAQAALDALKVG